MPRHFRDDDVAGGFGKTTRVLRLPWRTGQLGINHKTLQRNEGLHANDMTGQWLAA